jgi:hypothetical protein
MQFVFFYMCVFGCTYHVCVCGLDQFNRRVTRDTNYRLAFKIVCPIERIGAQRERGSAKKLDHLEIIYVTSLREI